MKKIIVLILVTKTLFSQDIESLAKNLKTCHKSFETGEALKAGYAYCVNGVTYISLNNSLSVLRDINDKLILCECKGE